MEFIDLKKQYQQIKPVIDKRINAVLDHGRYIMGPEVKELEERLAAYCGVKHCITCANGTDALQIALMALELKPGDEVIVPAFTYFATAEVSLVLGLKVVFVDIDPKTYNLDPEKLKAVITKKTKVIIPVSLFGQCADYDRINEIAKGHNISVIEDGAQSFGALYRKRRSLSLTDIACTSFFPSKPLGCYGDGGACFTNDDTLASRLRMIRTHGQSQTYHHDIVGVNSRLDTLQAAVLLAKYDILDDELSKRDTIGRAYSELLDGTVGTPYIEPYNTSVYAQYTIRTPKRDELKKYLAEKKIPTTIYYPKPMHLQKVFTDMGFRPGMFPVAEEVSQQVISLPMHPYLDQESQGMVVREINSFFKR